MFVKRRHTSRLVRSADGLAPAHSVEHPLAIPLHLRCPELFKVTSKGGVAEVWLLGQRLLELPTGARP